jgi:hypothetical protein
MSSGSTGFPGFTDFTGPQGGYGRRVAVRPGAPALTAYVGAELRAGVCPGRVPALVGSLVHACAAAGARYGHFSRTPGQR